ncbi:MAG: segregation/condensation protein A [candidate division NC10 bacterium]|nr:segregation/condensation protein A [candidate division NC10 bacterium]
MAYQVKLEVFEGPLDLLLHLIDENQIDIYDIPIARITKEYLTYLASTPQLDLDGAGEFLLMAATLIHIKSQMLLPKEEGEDELQAEDPRTPLVERLLEYKRFKLAAAGLRRLEERQQLVYVREEFGEGETPEGPLEIPLLDLLVAFRKILKRTSEIPVLVIEQEEIQIEERMASLLNRLAQESPLTFSSLFHGEQRRLGVIVTFLALLELLRQGAARARQSVPFGEIMIYRMEEGRPA